MGRCTARLSRALRDGVLNIITERCGIVPHHDASGTNGSKGRTLSANRPIKPRLPRFPVQSRFRPDRLVAPRSCTLLLHIRSDSSDLPEIVQVESRLVQVEWSLGLVRSVAEPRNYQFRILRRLRNLRNPARNLLRERRRDFFFDFHSRFAIVRYYGCDMQCTVPSNESTKLLSL